MFVGTVSGPRCRTLPGDPSFPSARQIAAFNASVGGRLINVMPSGEFCNSLLGGCTDAEWSSATFKIDIPGAMLAVNWEQALSHDYTSTPSSLCFRNSTTCGQGNVPVLGVNATTAAHIQAGVHFAREHNLKVSVKSTGHDYLGRSTAKGSFLLWTRYFEDITFHDTFKVGQKNTGSAVTVGSGVHLNGLYQAAKAQGKTYVGGSAATVAPAGGYVQGAGHSALSPMFGLAAENVLVTADGKLTNANEVFNPDLFWALRGGGAGSWGVVISATFITFPTFNAVYHQTVIQVNNSADVGKLAALHAQHIFDWDSFHAAQYFYWRNTMPTFTWTIDTVFPNTSIVAANTSLWPFLSSVLENGFKFKSSIQLADINDILTSSDDINSSEEILGSRLWSDDVYHGNFTDIGETYQRLFDGGAEGVLGNLIAGGQVSKNAAIDSAIHPKWRTAKTHIIVTRTWTDATSPTDVEIFRRDMTNVKVPILDALAGPGSGSYSNEADLREPNFQTTFFGPHYPRLSSIKARYDPHDIFIVGAGVGSERWDIDGLCRV
ncbi:FAD-binding domain-containing protein [Hysterangium stoloniferum]|nr:FAD-binding domain-containing protein [Hysterangium stoloniferum]